MQNLHLKRFLLFLKENNIIEEYELLFGTGLNYEALVDLSKTDTLFVMCSDMPTVKLYETLNNVKIDEEILNYIYHLSDINLKKYSLRVAISDSINNEEKIEYIKKIIHSLNVDNARYTYSLIMNDDIRNNPNCRDYLDLVSNSASDVSIQIRDLLVDSTFTIDEKTLDICKLIAEADTEYIAKYMVELYRNKVSRNEEVSPYFMSPLLYSRGLKQAQYAYQLLENKEFIKRKDYNPLAIVISTADFDYQAYNGYVEIMNNIKDNTDIVNKIIDIVNADKNYDFDIDVDMVKLIEERDLNKLIDALNHIPNCMEVNSDLKIKKYRK